MYKLKFMDLNKNPVEELSFKLKVIESAICMFPLKGFEETTFLDISKDVGCSQQAIYAHYKTKMDLLYACTLHAAEKGRDFIYNKANDEDSGLSRLKSYIQGNLEFFSTCENEAVAILALYYFASTHPKILEVYNFIQHVALKRITDDLTQAYNNGQIKKQDFENSALLIHSLMVGEIYKIYRDKGEKKINDRVNRAYSAALKLLA